MSLSRGHHWEAGAQAPAPRAAWSLTVMEIAHEWFYRLQSASTSIPPAALTTACGGYREGVTSRRNLSKV